MKIKDMRILLAALFVLLAASWGLAGVPGITERTGEKVPLEAPFVDSSGAPTTLGAVMEGPAILSFAYFGCEDICSTALSNLAGTLGRTTTPPGEGFTVITVSIDDNDGPAEALGKKKNFVKATGRAIGEGAWRFLTGERASIDALAGAAGFGFDKTEKGYDHPGALIVLASDGTITKYIYGISYLPADIEMAVLEAREGRLAASVKRAIRWCFSDAPAGRAYAQGVLTAVGVGTLVAASGLFIYLAARRRPGRKDPE